MRDPDRIAMMLRNLDESRARLTRGEIGKEDFAVLRHDVSCRVAEIRREGADRRRAARARIGRQGA